MQPDTPNTEKQRQPRPSWPVIEGSYRVGDPAAPVAVCALTSDELLVPLAAIPGVAIAGEVQTANYTVAPHYDTGTPCTGTSQQFTITVNPTPTVAAVSSQMVCNGGTTTPVSFSGTATSFTWSNDTPGIGLAASGTGDIGSFTAVNGGTVQLTAPTT